jgi:hypothetical protein
MDGVQPMRAMVTAERDTRALRGPGVWGAIRGVLRRWRRHLGDTEYAQIVCDAWADE